MHSYYVRIVRQLFYSVSFGVGVLLRFVFFSSSRSSSCFSFFTSKSLQRSSDLCSSVVDLSFCFCFSSFSHSCCCSACTIFSSSFAFLSLSFLRRLFLHCSRTLRRDLVDVDGMIDAEGVVVQSSLLIRLSTFWIFAYEMEMDGFLASGEFSLSLGGSSFSGVHPVRDRSSIMSVFNIIISSFLCWVVGVG